MRTTNAHLEMSDIKVFSIEAEDLMTHAGCRCTDMSQNICEVTK